MDWIYGLILGACGVASFLLLMGLYEAWRIYWSPRQKLLGRRMQQLFNQEQHVQTPILRRRDLSRFPILDRWLSQVPGIQSVDRFLRQADLCLQ